MPRAVESTAPAEARLCRVEGTSPALTAPPPRRAHRALVRRHAKYAAPVRPRKVCAGAERAVAD